MAACAHHSSVGYFDRAGGGAARNVCAAGGFEDRTEVTVEDWEIAKLIHRRSVQTRQAVVDQLAADRQRSADATQDRAVNRALAEDEAREERIRESMAKSIARRVHGDGRVVKKGTLKKATSGKHRKLVAFDDATAIAEQYGWIIAVDGGWRPGPSRPT